MSLVSIPFVESSADTVLHIAASILLIGSIAAGLFGFWKLHEIPIQKAHKNEHHQVGLITALTWIGFIWHWVWVLAIIIAFLDLEKAILRLRQLWNSSLNENEVEEA
ncbi:MFS transporter [Vibrio mediterranei]|jgi:hypothetical protein|uniref:MFS transporter n=1 Tax=Vibrio barjaei TaxID=1676683 RepID=A0ABW7IFI3_9VIBR